MSPYLRRFLAVTIASLIATATAHAGVVRPADEGTSMVPTGKGWGVPAATGDVSAPAVSEPGEETDFVNPNPQSARNNGILYHGGPIIPQVTAYFIWYGNWTGNSATTILTDLVKNLGGSPYYNINTTYYDGNNVHVGNVVVYGGSTTDNYSRGTALSDADIQTIVTSAISSARLPKDPSGVYFVLTSADVTATSGFCTQYCGWHDHATILSSDIKYSFVGNPDRCPSACEAQSASSPNSNPGADGMASILVHELEEAVTDPDLNAWYDNRGYENADKCAWTFGTTYTVANGSKANMKLGPRDFLIQQNWVNAKGGYCAKSY